MSFPPHSGGPFFEVDQEYRHRPAEYCRKQRGWFQDGRKLRNVKASKAFVWPKDGRNGTSWGRFKDILQNKGPDMYLTLNADKHDYMHNRPTRAQWSGYRYLDDRGLDIAHPFTSKKHAPWTRTGWLGGRTPGQSYDFRTRQYGIPNRGTWTDAVWQPDPRKNKYNRYPEAVRNVYGEWFQDFRYVPQWLGGPISNEKGRGRFHKHLEPDPW